MTSFLLFIGAGFFLFEAVLHAFALPILEHDRIFLFTHDRYIALYALTMAVMMVFVATNVQKYRLLFYVTMGSILLGIMNASLIASLGGYEVLFPSAREIDGELSLLGVGVVAWYLATWGAFVLSPPHPREK